MLNPGISCHSQTGIFFMNHFDTVIPLSPFFTLLRASVGRAVIDHNDFKVRIRLVYDAFHTPVKMFFYIENGYYNSYKFLVHSHFSICPAISSSTICSLLFIFSCSLDASDRPSFTVAHRSQVEHLSRSSFVTLPSR